MPVPAKATETDLAAFAKTSTCETQDPFLKISSLSRLVCLLLERRKKHISVISEQDSHNKTYKVLFLMCV